MTQLDLVQVQTALQVLALGSDKGATALSVEKANAVVQRFLDQTFTELPLTLPEPKFKM